MDRRNKPDWRRSALTARRAIAAARPELAAALSRQLADWLADRRFASAGLYWPVNAEPDPRPALVDAWRAGRVGSLALPVIAGQPAGEMVYGAWRPGDPTCPNRYGVSEPWPVAEVTPELVLAPCLAARPDGLRLGYGGGYFDRYLAQRRARGGAFLAVALVYQELISADLPGEALDQRFDWLISEAGARPAQ